MGTIFVIATSIIEAKNTESSADNAQLFAASGLAAGLLASCCCLLPLFLVSVGIGGAWMAQLTALEPYRPIFLGGAAVALGLGFWRAYRRQDCAVGALCANPRASRMTKTLLWLGVVVVLAVVSVDLVTPLNLWVRNVIIRIIILLGFFYQPALGAERSVVLSVSNMTCALCPLTVRSAISQVPGVISVDVDLDRAQAVVKYDEATATTDAIAAASGNAGYPATVVKVQ